MGRYLIMCFLAMGVCFSAAHPALANGASEPDIEELSLHPENVSWSQLELGASRLGLSVSVDISLRRLQDATATHNLVVSDRGQSVSAHRGDVMMMVFHAVSLGKELETSLWFDSRNAAALQRIRHVITRGDERLKIDRYTHEGLFAIRKKPRPDELGKPVTQWTDISRKFISFPAILFDDAVVSEPSALIYIVSVLDLKNPGDQVELLAYFDDRLHIVTIELEGVESVETDFRLRQGGLSKKVRGRREALRYALWAHALSAPQERSRLWLNGLGGDLKLLIDRYMRVPLELRGSVRVLGKMKLHLKKVKLLPLSDSGDASQVRHRPQAGSGGFH